MTTRLLDKLAAARDALSHSHPDATEQDVIEAGLDALIAQAQKRKGLATRPQKNPRPSSDPAHVPAAVRRAVWERDGGRCQHRLANGERCGSTRQVEVDHVVPLALGGASTVENCQLACKAHNLERARRKLGAGLMDRYAPRRRDREKPDGSRGGAAAPTPRRRPSPSPAGAGR